MGAKEQNDPAAWRRPSAGNFFHAIAGPRDLYLRVRCLFTGHRYHYAMHGCALYFCKNGCGREFLQGYMSAAEYQAAMDALPPITDELREWDEQMDETERSS